MSKSVLDLISKLGKVEDSLKDMKFVSPVYKNRNVITRIAGIIYPFSIPETKSGWYKFKPKNRKEARVDSACELQEVEGYLKCLKKVRMILVQRDGDIFYGVPFKNNDQGLDFKTLYPIYLVTDDYAMDFDEVICRFDGSNLWYQSVEMNNNQQKVDYLRRCLLAAAFPKNLVYLGLRFEDKMAYACRCEIDKKVLARNKEYTLKKAVEHAGGIFKTFTEKGDHFSITYEVDGERYTSTVSKADNQQVLTAGICLSGGDKKFDLTSLVSVIREGQNRDLIHRTR
jgi:hypothetical protein